MILCAASPLLHRQYCVFCGLTNFDFFYRSLVYTQIENWKKCESVKLHQKLEKSFECFSVESGIWGGGGKRRMFDVNGMLLLLNRRWQEIIGTMNQNDDRQLRRQWRRQQPQSMMAKVKGKKWFLSESCTIRWLLGDAFVQKKMVITCLVCRV